MTAGKVKGPLVTKVTNIVMNTSECLVPLTLWYNQLGHFTAIRRSASPMEDSIDKLKLIPVTKKELGLPG